MIKWKKKNVRVRGGWIELILVAMEGGVRVRKAERSSSCGVVVSPYFPPPSPSPSTDLLHVLPPGFFLRRPPLLSPYFQPPSSSSTFNSLLPAYRRKRSGNLWTPPTSIYGLLQEKYSHDPWKVLIICILLNRTTGRQAVRVIANLFELCPNAKAATTAETEKIENIITTLGLQKKRSVMIQRFSQEYLSDKWTHVTQLHGIGKYAADAYAIFCTGRWKDINPDDHKLVPYWEDLWYHKE